MPTSTKVSGEIGKMTIEGGKYAFARFVLAQNEFRNAWSWVYGTWFPQSGYQPDYKPCFEFYPEAPSNNKYTVDLCIPVKPL